MKIETEVKGIKELGAKYKKISRNLPVKVVRQMNAAVLLVQGEAKKSIQRGGGGGTVTRYNPKREHQVSAPKSAPATDRGNLVRSITIDVRRKFKDIVGIVSTKSPYATALEFGAERPFMRPALRKMRKKVLALLGKGVKSAL